MRVLELQLSVALLAFATIAAPSLKCWNALLCILSQPPSTPGRPRREGSSVSLAMRAVFTCICAIVLGIGAAGHAGRHSDIVAEVLRHAETVARVGRGKAARLLKSGMGGRHSCGNDEPALQSLTQRKPETIVVGYSVGTDTETAAATTARRLQRTAVSQQTAEPIRIKLLYNQLDGQVSSAVPEMCASATATASVLSASGGRVAWPCTNDAVPSGARGDQIRRRLQWAVDRLQASIRVNRVASGNPIVIPTQLLNEFYIPVSDATVEDTDLVIIAVAWPSPNVPAAGWAACRAYDQNGRCVVSSRVLACCR